MTLFPRLGVAGISTPLPFRYPQPVKMSISIASSPRLSDTTYLNLNSLLVKRQIDNPSPGAVTGGDTLSSDSSEEEIRDSGRSFQSLISSSELSDDSVSPPVTAPGEGLSIWRFTSKLFRFR